MMVEEEVGGRARRKENNKKKKVKCGELIIIQSSAIIRMAACPKKGHNFLAFESIIIVIMPMEIQICQTCWIHIACSYNFRSHHIPVTNNV